MCFSYATEVNLAAFSRVVQYSLHLINRINVKIKTFHRMGHFYRSAAVFYVNICIMERSNLFQTLNLYLFIPYFSIESNNQMKKSSSEMQENLIFITQKPCNRTGSKRAEKNPRLKAKYSCDQLCFCCIFSVS